MSFKEYYSDLKGLQAEMKNRIIERLEITDKTFYNRLNNNQWKKHELELIEKIKEEVTRDYIELK